MDLTRDPCALVRDRPPELGVRDRAPDADEQEPEGDQAQEVALEDELARDDRRQHEVDVREERERHRQAEPAVEVAPVAAVANPEADQCDEPEAGEQCRGDDDGRPFDEFDGCGDGAIDVLEASHVNKEYNLWSRNPIKVSAAYLGSDGAQDRPPAETNLNY